MSKRLVSLGARLHQRTASRNENRRKQLKATTADRPDRVSETLVEIAQSDVETVLKSLHSSQTGLSRHESQRRIERYGLNEVANEKPPTWYVQLLKTVANPLVILLLALASISLVTGDTRAATIIVIMVVFSVLLRFSQEFRSNLAAAKLKEMVANTATVSRSDQPIAGVPEIGTSNHAADQLAQQEIPIKFLVPGDVVHLSAGDMIPADLRLISAKDLFVSQGTLTGESLPIEKHPVLPDREATLKNPLELTNLCFMGTTIVSGTGMAIVVETGGNTYLGSIAKTVVGQKAMTSFDRGVNGVSFLLLRFMLVMAPVVFLINGLVKGNWGEAFFFALSVAVGLAPEMLPMIVTANLARGAIAMSDKQVIVKNLDAIQNFGAMDIICTDKTGTLTQDKIVLKRHLDIDGKESEAVLEFAYLNSYYQTGLKNLLDVAVLEHIDVHEALQAEANYRKIDEIPFDFERRRMSVVVEEKSHHHELICKGAVEEMLQVCTQVQAGKEILAIDPTIHERVANLTRELNEDGFRVVAVAYKELPLDQIHYAVSDERDLILMGFIAFLDPPKDSAAAALKALARSGVRVKVLTGDNEIISRKICKDVGLYVHHILLGTEMVYMSTVVTAGRGEVVVTETGMNTELGRIANTIQQVEPEPTLLQKRLDRLGQILIFAALVLVGAIVLLEMLRGQEIQLVFLSAITLVVAALPEGLPAVVSISLALGAQQMLARRALIRNLPAVETLGSVTVICAGKTGTLTVNQMTVTILNVAGHRLDLTTQMRGPLPVIDADRSRPFLLSQPPALALLLASLTLCNNAKLEADWEEPRHFRAVGDPSEGAMVFAAAEQGLWQDDLERALPRIAEILFDSKRQRMTTIHRFPTDLADLPCAMESLWHWSCAVVGAATYVAFVRGKVDSLLEVANYVWLDDGAKPLDGNSRERIHVAHQQLVRDGLQVFGIAFRSLTSERADGWQDVEQDLTFLGLVGLTDPARPEAREAIAMCKAAGIRPILVTGDYPISAWHLAKEVGITTNNRILTSKDIAHLPGAELAALVEEVSVFAQISPDDKLEIVRLLQQRGHIVAMTGDGMNDAPALKVADIGIAMGLSGTDVAKNAADMVLLDDNFATIVAAVKEGRIIYDNIRKFIKYLLSSNIGELLVMLLAPLMGMPLPLLPLQILWINLTTDGLPALALGLEPAERDTMNRPPYPPNENFFARGMGRGIIWTGLLLGLVSFGTGYLYWQIGNPGWQTMVFTTLTLSQMGNALAVRSERDSLFTIGLLSNQPLLAAVLVTLGLQLAVIYVPVLQNIFTTRALSFSDLVICLILSSSVFWAVELEKWLVRRRSKV